MYVCVCYAVTDTEIRQAMQKGARTLRDLQQDLKVATCCGKCGTCARKILNEDLSNSIASTEVMLEGELVLASA